MLLHCRNVKKFELAQIRDNVVDSNYEHTDALNVVEQSYDAKSLFRMYRKIVENGKNVV